MMQRLHIDQQVKQLAPNADSQPAKMNLKELPPEAIQTEQTDWSPNVAQLLKKNESVPTAACLDLVIAKCDRTLRS